MPVIRARAERMGRRFTPRVQQELVEESVSHVGLALQRYRRGAGTFEGWLDSVLYNLAVSLRRRQLTREPLNQARTGQDVTKDDPLRDLPDREPTAEPDDPSTRQELADRLGRLRQVLDQIGWPPGRAIDLFALLLLETRLRIGQGIRLALENEAFAPGSPGQQAAAWLAWRPYEETRQLQSSWPLLRHCWEVLAPELDRLGVQTTDLLDALNPHLPPPGTSAGVWGQWVYRACKEAKAQMPLEEWNRLFARLFPGRRSHQENTS